MTNKLLLKFLLVSVLLHVLFVGIFSLQKRPRPDHAVEISWQVLEEKLQPPEQSLPPTAPTTFRPVIPSPEAEKKSAEPEPAPVIISEQTQEPQDTTAVDSSINSFWINPLMMAKANIHIDSTIQQQTTGPLKPLPPASFTAPAGVGGDRIDQELYRRNMGHTQTVPADNLLLKGARYLKDKLAKEKPPELNFIPTAAQLAVFKMIWEKSSATDLEIYAGLDSAINITAEDLRAELARLEQLNFLERKIVSPRNEFTIITPLGSKAIEMSPTNRRNRIFEYQANIPKDQMLQFLNAALYQVTHGLKREFHSTLDSLSLVKDLERKILLLTAEEGE